MPSAPETVVTISSLNLHTGEGRRIELPIELAPFELGGQTYLADPIRPQARLEASRHSSGFAFKLNFPVHLEGPCMRCLEPADASFDIDAREISQPGAGDELDSPYVEAGVLDVAAWARDALALSLPRAILCRADCAGLCPICGADLNNAGPEHQHESEPDSRWAKLSEIKFDA